MDEERLKAWFEGDLEDDELTKKEVRWLEKRVYKAIQRKVFERPGVTLLPEHPTLQ